MKNKETEVTLEYIQNDGKSIIIVTHRPGQESIRTIADTVPPREGPNQTPSQEEGKK